MFALFSGWYYWVPKMLGLMYKISLGNIQFWILFIGVNLTFFPQHFLGLQGMPRRISDYPDAYTGWNIISSYGSIVSVIATLVFLILLYIQLSKGKAVSGYPWLNPQHYSDTIQALLNRVYNSLEWSLDNPPKPHAFTSLPIQAVLSSSSSSSSNEDENSESGSNENNNSESRTNGNENSELTSTENENTESRLNRNESTQSRSNENENSESSSNENENSESSSDGNVSDENTSNGNDSDDSEIQESGLIGLQDYRDTNPLSRLDAQTLSFLFSGDIERGLEEGRLRDVAHDYVNNNRTLNGTPLGTTGYVDPRDGDIEFIDTRDGHTFPVSIQDANSSVNASHGFIYRDDAWVHDIDEFNRLNNITPSGVINSENESQNNTGQSNTGNGSDNVNSANTSNNTNNTNNTSVNSSSTSNTNDTNDTNDSTNINETNNSGTNYIPNTLEEFNMWDYVFISHFSVYTICFVLRLISIVIIVLMMAKKFGFFMLPPKPHSFIKSCIKSSILPYDPDCHRESEIILDKYNVDHIRYTYNETLVEQLSPWGRNKRRENIESEMRDGGHKPETVSIMRSQLEEKDNITDEIDQGDKDDDDWSDAPRAWGLYFQDSASPQMEGIVELHNLIMYFLIIILFSVGWILLTIIKNFSHNKWPISNKYLNHGTLIELIWTISPAIILILIAFPSFKLLYVMDEVIDPILTISTTAHQWYWSYEYPDFYKLTEEFLNFDSYIVPTSDLEQGNLRMLEVDNKVILPELTHVRFILTSEDVIHSYACPALGIKCDAYPGRLNQFSTYASREGTFYGQCSEICGLLHSSMPIAIESVSLERFLLWLKEQL